MPTISILPTPADPSRPKGVAAISIYYFAGAIAAPLLLFLTRQDQNRFSQAALLFISPVLIVLSVGLWKMKNWARVSAALLTAVGLVAGVVSKIFSYGILYALDTWTLALTISLDLLSFAVNLWILLYLMSSRVRRAFL